VFQTCYCREELNGNSVRIFFQKSNPEAAPATVNDGQVFITATVPRAWEGEYPKVIYTFIVSPETGLNESESVLWRAAQTTK